MGLAISVGFLAFLQQDGAEEDQEETEWFRAELEGLNAVLVENGLSAHTEPEELPELEFHGLHEFSYSTLHYLRRAYAYLQEGLPIPDGDLTPEHDALILDQSSMLDSHLLCHSDAEGYYGPQDFADPIFDEALTGGIVGSSQALARELLGLAPSLKIELVEGKPSEATLVMLSEVNDEAAHYREKLVWLALWEATRASIEHGALIVFC